MAAQRGKKPSTRKKLTTGDKLPVSDSLPLFFARMLANDLSPKSRVKMLCDGIDSMIFAVQSLLPKDVLIVPLVNSKLSEFGGVKGKNMGFIFVVELGTNSELVQELRQGSCDVQSRQQPRQTSQKQQLS